MGVQTKQFISDAAAQLAPADAILLFLSLILEGNEAPELLARLPHDRYQAFEPHLLKLLGAPPQDLRFPLLDEIQKISKEKVRSGLEEMDGSWLLHHLSTEKPAVTGLVLKRLSSDRVYQILDSMKPELKAELPDASELDQVDSEIVRVVREQFEKQMPEFPVPTPNKVLDFRCIFNLSGEDLLTLVRDLGLELLAVGFQSVHERSLIELVKNLENEEAEKLFEKFKNYNNASRGDVKNAQLEILTLSLDFKDGDDMVLEAGVQRLARALAGTDEEWLGLLQYRLPLRQGYRLQRYYDDFRHGTHKTAGGATLAQKYQRLVVARLFALSCAGTIDRSLAKLNRGLSVSTPSKTMKPTSAAAA